MPRGKSPGPSVKRPKQYEAMRDQGMSEGQGRPHLQRRPAGVP